MSKINNGGFDQYGAEPFEQQKFGIAGVEGVNTAVNNGTGMLLSRTANMALIGYDQ